MQRRVITAHECTAVTQVCKLVLGLGPNKPGAKCGKAAWRASEKNVQAVQVCLLSVQVPFAEGNVLVSLASGVAASEDVKKDMSSAVQRVGRLKKTSQIYG